MDCRLQKRCMCLSFKRHPELQFFPLSPSLCLSLPLPFFPPSPRHLVLLRHSYKHAAQVPARRDAGAGRGSISPGPEQALFQKVQGGSVSFFMSNPGTGTAPGAAAASLRAGRELPSAAPGCSPLSSAALPFLCSRGLTETASTSHTPTTTKNPSQAKCPSTTSALCHDELRVPRSPSSVKEAGNAGSWRGDAGPAARS